MNYVEFRLTVPIFDLGGENSKDCAEICAICEELGVTRLEQSLDEQYHSIYDYACARYPGDPSGRIGRGDIRVVLADLDDQTFLSVDMFAEATDQMNTVELGVRCAESHVARVSTLLGAIRNEAEVCSALLQGNLGLAEKLQPGNFPRQVNNNGNIALQHVTIYRGGVRHSGKGDSCGKGTVDFRSNKLLQNDRAGIAALPVLKSLSPARHLSKTFGSFGAQAMYVFFPEPESLASFAPLLLPVARNFNAVVGNSLFGDLFLRDSGTGEYAILIVSTLELVDTGEIDEAGFREQILGNPEVVRTLLRPNDVAELAQRLGAPDRGAVFYPVPIPALGGPGEIATFQKGGLREYLGVIGQTVR